MEADGFYLVLSVDVNYGEHFHVLQAYEFMHDRDTTPEIGDSASPIIQSI